MCLFGGEIGWKENFGENREENSFGVYLVGYIGGRKINSEGPKCFLPKIERKLSGD